MTAAAPAPPTARAGSLADLALRANPRRRLLVVSRVLAKHVPTPAPLARLAGGALALVAAGDERAARAVAALGDADVDGAIDVLASLAACPARLGADVTVVGLAETATGLGHAVADAVDADLTLHSTRDPGVPAGLTFEETHSHAPRHRLHVPAALGRSRTIVLVDDELTTGRTVRALVARLRAHAPDARYVVAALVEALDPEARARLAQERIAVVALASASASASDEDALGPEPDEACATAGPPVPAARTDVRPRVTDLTFGGAFAPGRLGATRADRGALHELAADVAAACDVAVDGVLGTGELIHLPVLVADGLGVPCWSTTRSPIRLSGAPGYPVRSGVAFGALDGADRTEFLYNVAGHRRLLVLHGVRDELRHAGDLLAALHAAGVRDVVRAVPGA